MHIAKKTLVLGLASALLVAGLGACGDRTPGENLDRALDKTGETVKEAGEAIKPQ